MIIHSDTDEDETHRNVKPESEAPSSLHPGPMTRTRKARDAAQLRLGIGRPTVAGGSGPRTATRSASSVAKGVRSRSGRGAKPTPAPIVEGLLGLFIPPVTCPLLRQYFAPFIGLYVCLIDHKTFKLHTTGTPEDAPQPPSSHGTSQSRTIENGRIRRTSTMDTNTDQAGIRRIVEEQVCFLPLTPLLSHTSVGTAPTTHGCITAEATSATGSGPFPRSSCAERQGYDNNERVAGVTSARRIHSTPEKLHGKATVGIKSRSTESELRATT
jgi:hypothetical protein